MWGTLQSRLAVEMRIRGIKTPEEANRFLRQYTEQHNTQFAEEAADAVSDFLPCPAPESLRLILGYRDERKASSGSEISWKGAKYQLVDEKGRLRFFAGEKQLRLFGLRTERSLRSAKERRRRRRTD